MIFFKSICKITAGGLTLALLTGDGFAAPSPEDILKKVDSIRNPSESYEMSVRVGESLFLVSISGNTKTLVKTLEPNRDRGRDLLMIQEEMWAYLPNLKRPVRISLNQKLTGLAANGDISRMRWSGDYLPTLEAEDRKTWTLALLAKKKGLTYERVRVWVDKNNFFPDRAEYLTRSGKVLKRSKFEGYRLIAGNIRPTILKIESATDDSEPSVIEVQSMVTKEFPANLFNPQRLGQ